MSLFEKLYFETYRGVIVNVYFLNVNFLWKLYVKIKVVCCYFG